MPKRISETREPGWFLARVLRSRKKKYDGIAFFRFLETKGQFFVAAGSPAFGLIFLLPFDYAQGDNEKDFAAIRFIK